MTNKKCEIHIPNGALVGLCAARNSGKTQFCKKHFEGVQNCKILCLDDILENVIDEADDSDTAQSIRAKTNLAASTIAYVASISGRTLVYDSMNVNLNKRISVLNKLRPYFSKIILIVIDLDEDDLAKHGVKATPSKVAKYGFYHPGTEVSKADAAMVKAQIANQTIGLGVDEVYLLTSKTLDKCCVTFG